MLTSRPKQYVLRLTQDFEYANIKRGGDACFTSPMVGGNESVCMVQIGSYCQSMNTIKSFFAKIRQKLFDWRTNREIFHRISPHLHNEADHGYSFRSKDELAETHIRGCLDAGINMRLIERTAAEMPKFYGDAFRHIAYRDLNERMQMYLELAESRLVPDVDPRFVATRA
jgi:hypothetical protein